VIIGVRGRYALPAVRTYPKPLYAAIYADEEWRRQSADGAHRRDSSPSNRGRPAADLAISAN